MGKRAPGDAVAQGRAALVAEGITTAALAAGAVARERLAEILRDDATTGPALAELLGGVPRAEHAALLAAAEAHTHGFMRREVRRALFRLHRAGIETPTVELARTAEGAPAVEPE